MTILGVSGSLRQGSSNTALLVAAKTLAASVATVQIHGSLDDLPYFNPDLDRESPPAAVDRFRQAIASANALLISTPEYAHGIPGVLKNALDWLVADPRFVGKPVGVLFGSASDSSFARNALIEVLNTMSARVIPEAVISIPGVRVKFGVDGKLLDEQLARDILCAVRALDVV
jgi:NAD(P)H-dependent FMN reductase